MAHEWSLLHQWMNIKESTIVQRVGAKAQDGKMRWIMITSTTMDTVFNLQNSHSQVDFAKIDLWQIFQLSILVLSRDKHHYQSHWMRNFRFFFSYIGFLLLLGQFEGHCLWAIRIFNVLSAIIRGNTNKRIVRALPFIHQPDRVARKASDE